MALATQHNRPARSAVVGVDYCPRCGAALTEDEGASWPYCPQCDWTEDDDFAAWLVRVVASARIQVNMA
jgi:hypothetical protein